MTPVARVVFACLLVLGLCTMPGSARASALQDTSLTNEVVPLPDSIGRRGGWGGRGFRGHRFHGPRFHPHRAYYRPHRPRPVYVYHPRPAYPYSCIRRGWVWNGWQHVWRRYRVC